MIQAVNKTDILIFKKDIDIFDGSSNFERRTLRVCGLETKILEGKSGRFDWIALKVPKHMIKSGTFIIHEKNFYDLVETRYAMERFYDRYGLE